MSKSSKKSARPAFDGDVDAWCEHHDQYAPQHWLYLVLNGTYSVAEMRDAILADRSPRESAS